MAPNKGGVGQAVRTLVGSLTNEGIINEIVSLDFTNESFLENETAVIHATGPGTGPWCYGAKMSRWLHVNVSRFNVIIVHGLWLYSGYAARKAWQHHIRRNARLKINISAPLLYVMPHGMLDPYFQKARGRKLKALRNWMFWKLIERKLVNEADGLLFTSLRELQLARQPFRPYRPKKEIVVGLGTEKPPAFHPSMQHAFQKHCPDGYNRPYLLFLGRIDEKKGIDLLLDAYSNLHRKTIILPKLVIAGPGVETTYGRQMQWLVKEKGLEKEVYLPGMLSGDSKWGAFYGCEAFILPSHQENFGIAVVEALSCAKPVLISDQVNIWQEITQASAGLVAGDNIEGCHQLLEQWFRMSEAEKANMGVQAKNCYHNHFAVAPAAKRFLEAIGD